MDNMTPANCSSFLDNIRLLWIVHCPEHIMPEGVWSQVEFAYCQPHRSYHTLQHINECFELASIWPTPLPSTVWAALLFHDIVYDTRKSDNEEKSAALAQLTLGNLGWSASEIDQTCRLIKVTATHEATDELSQVVCDIDLSILGADHARFAEYETQIRREYGWVPSFIFKSKRREILQKFSKKDPLFHSHFLIDRLRQALANLRNIK